MSRRALLLLLLLLLPVVQLPLKKKLLSMLYLKQPVQTNLL